MARVRNLQRLKNKMKNLLIGAGLEGLSQKTIVQKCRTYNTKANPNGFTGDDVREVLSLWRRNGLVQRFDQQIGYAKKPTRIWRATEDIKRGVL